MPDWIENIVSLRQKLHKKAELSGFEKETTNIIQTYLEQFKSVRFETNLGGSHGFMAIFDSGLPGQTLVFRGDIDAISQQKGAAHRCGHDGHSAILCGLAHELDLNLPLRGKVVLLFQAEEETGQGAKAVLNDARFLELRPDCIIGIHNIPKYKKATILLKEGVFSWGSLGFRINFHGQSAHAAYPQKGIYTALAINDMSDFLLKEITEEFDENTMITITHTKLGTPGFGITPGFAEMNIVIRSSSGEHLEQAVELIKMKAKELAAFYKLQLQYQIVEPFPATVNHRDAIKMIKQLCEEKFIKHELLKEAFRWSEDFGHYMNSYYGALIGIGSGKAQAELHDDLYEFPDDIIDSSVVLLNEIVKNYMD